MRILTLCPYFYNSNYPEHTKNKTGFGIMVMGIVNSLCEQGNEVFVLTHTLCPQRVDGALVILKHKLIGVLLHAPIFGLCIKISSICRLAGSLGAKLKLLYYFLDKGCVKNAILRIKPDIVHIHGVGLGSKNYVEVCQELDVPFVITAHGLIENDPSASQAERKFEMEFFRESERTGIPVTVVSTGIKRRLTQDYYGLNNADNIHVVTNGTDTHMMETTDDIRSKHGIPDGCKICLAVGSVCENKNQLQIVRAFSVLPSRLRENTRVLIIGKTSDNYQIKQEISRLGLDDYVKCCGFVKQEKLRNYYATADLNILASKDEGFGLSIIEGFVYGAPCVTFSDLDAVSDVYDENAMELCDDRADESFSKAIAAALEKQWDKDQIKQHSKKFFLQAMGEKYMNVYTQTINGFINCRTFGGSNERKDC